MPVGGHDRQAKTEVDDEAMRRFIPYVQMYEFEGLLFSCPNRLAAGINQPALEDKFLHIRNEFDTPETINNSPMTAPSKRLLKLYEGYDKPLHGSVAAIEIGLPAIRSECARFDAWLRHIEALLPIQ
jgi:G:T/U-mismatch repair DNA glycosylase